MERKGEVEPFHRFAYITMSVIIIMLETESFRLIDGHSRGVGRTFSGGGVRFKCYFSKRFVCTDLTPNTLYRKCIQFA